ncbi:MAG: sugar-binding domain-containing protein [Bacteroidota bacterium]
MKLTNFTIILFLIFPFFCSAQWQAQGDKIKTKWADEINPNSVLPEYPRPQMVRTDWQNLNGLWDYAIKEAGSKQPNTFDGKILVPFAVESSLSGVQKEVGKENELWYHREFEVPSNWKNKSILLHFGAVDWRSEIWLNDIKIGHHEGGYDPFYFDITPFLKSGKQKLVVKVWDPTNDGTQPRGKQVKDPKGIWYTSVTGIWQTVWIEAVPDKYIEHIKVIPNIDQQLINVEVRAIHDAYGDLVEAKVLESGKVIASAKSIANQKFTIHIPSPKLWSPESPILYDLEVMLSSKGKIVDEVNSYFAMRKVSYERDEKGIMRLQLNNKNYFQFGTLDQGWWPDGLYTAPSDEALAYDIMQTKEYGFNMIRKHVKVEPARWYAHCDRIGMLVWQDMPNGDAHPVWHPHKYAEGDELKRTPASEKIYRTEWKAIMDFLYNSPSIVCWVPFNERWGQFKTAEITAWTKDYDPSRLVNPASGGNHFPIGDMLDLHNYPGPKLYLYDAQRPTVLGEYGGIGLALEGHLWEPERNWGYVQFKNSEEATDQYLAYIEELKTLVMGGFSAAIYTQTTDVEIEINGLMTYDRKILKLEKEKVSKANRELIDLIK